MQRLALVTALIVLPSAVVSAQPAAPLPVRVVNLPPIQSVTGNELLASQELLTLLLVHASGILPPGLSVPEAEQCLVTGVGELYEVEVAAISTDQISCNLNAYAAACATAARRARLECERTCEQFEVLHGHRMCRGHVKPVIEPFFHNRHCFSPPEEPATVTCVVTGWCSCDP